MECRTSHLSKKLSLNYVNAITIIQLLLSLAEPVQTGSGCLSIPFSSLVITLRKDNIAYIELPDSELAHSKSFSVPLLCPKNYELPSDGNKTATCNNGIWIIPPVQCVPMRTRLQVETDFVLQVAAGVTASVSLLFVLITQVCYQYRKRSSKKRQQNPIELRPYQSRNSTGPPLSPNYLNRGSSASDAARSSRNFQQTMLRVGPDFPDPEELFRNASFSV